MKLFLDNYKLNYRQDIDSLRGVAVLSVVFYHLAPGRIPGGFTGVDIFFVISGYLITSIILKEKLNNTFSLYEFYSRRIKRLFPALIIVLFSCFLFGVLFLPEIYFQQLSKHLAASSIFMLNFILIGEIGYFDVSALFKPLLHLWSLSIEEQFYIIFPIFILIINKFDHKFLYSLIVLFFLLISFNIYYLEASSFSFYFPLTRFWEILSGSILSILVIFYKKNFNIFGKKTLFFLLLLGYFIVFYSFFFIDKNYIFPGYIVILPVLGSFLILFAGSFKNINTFIFSNKILAWFGLISFPLYLWHWPIISFLRIIEGDEISRWIRLFILIISIFFAWLTYEFVEKKIRFSKNKNFTIILCAIIICLGAVGFASYKYKILNLHLFANIKYEGEVGHNDFFNYIKKNFNQCNKKKIINIVGDFTGLKRCYESNLKKEIEYIVVGDSTAEHFYPGIANHFANSNVAGYFVEGLPSSINNKYNIIFNELNLMKNIKGIFVSANWHSLKEKNNFDYLKKYIKKISKVSKNIYVINGTQNFSYHPSKCKYYNKLFIDSNKCDQVFELNNLPSLENLLSLDSKIKILSTNEILCKPFEPKSRMKKCNMYFNKKVLYRDNLHLNIDGSNFFAKKIAKMINEK